MTPADLANAIQRHLTDNMLRAINEIEELSSNDIGVVDTVSINQFDANLRIEPVRISVAGYFIIGPEGIIGLLLLPVGLFTIIARRRWWLEQADTEHYIPWF